MKAPDDKLKAEIQRLIEQGAGILKRVQSLPHAMPGEEIAEVSSWVTRLGQLVTKIYGEKSQQFSTYSQALATTNFYCLHSNHNAHIAQLLGVAKSVDHDLKHGSIPSAPSDGHAITLTDEYGLWWFFQHCTTKTRAWLITTLFIFLSTVATAAYLAGRSHFISQVIDLWKKGSAP